MLFLPSLIGIHSSPPDAEPLLLSQDLLPRLLRHQCSYQKAIFGIFVLHPTGCLKQSDEINLYFGKLNYLNRIRSFSTTSPPIHYQTQTIMPWPDYSKITRSRRNRTPRCWNLSRLASSIFVVETMTSETEYCETSAGRSAEECIG